MLDLYVDGLGSVGIGGDLCAGLLYEHRFAMPINNILSRFWIYITCFICSLFEHWEVFWVRWKAGKVECGKCGGCRRFLPLRLFLKIFEYLKQVQEVWKVSDMGDGRRRGWGAAGWVAHQGGSEEGSLAIALSHCHSYCKYIILSPPY